MRSQKDLTNYLNGLRRLLTEVRLLANLLQQPTIDLEPSFSATWLAVTD